MRRRRLGPFLVVSLVAALSLEALLAPAAENFVCGAGGKPDPKSSKCLCPAGKIEKTTGGTSRCVDKPIATPKPSTSTKPTTTTTATTATTTPPLPTGTVTIPPIPTGTVIMPSTMCGPAQVLIDGSCRDRCGRTETWNGSLCVQNTPNGSGTKTVTCDSGQFPDAGGHCCYSGQVFIEGANGGRCRGTPSCPSGTMQQGETCIVVACLAGQERAADGVHCCWSGQDWSSEVQRCVGAPTCPDGYTVEDDRCMPLRLCDPGMIAVDVQHCCYPNQHWMMRGDGAVGCGGPPACPPPLVVLGEDCVAPGKIKDDDDRATRVTRWGAGYVTFDFNYNLVSTVESTPDASTGKYNAYGLGLAIHPSGFPLRLTFGGFFGKGMLDGGSDSTSMTGYVVGAAFAPLSLPNAVGGSFSFLNPWLGVEYRGWATSTTSFCESSSGGCVAPLSRGTAISVDVGNMIIYKQFGLVLSYSKSVSGDGSVPTSIFSFGLSYLLSPAF